MIKITYISMKQIDTQKGLPHNEKKMSLPNILVSNSFINHYQLNSSEVIIKFGQWSKKFNVKIDQLLSKQEIGFISDTIPFSLPENQWLDIKVKGNVIHIGPFIAFIAKNNSKSLSMSTLENYKNRLQINEENGRFIIICSSDSIDTNTQTITGYYYKTSARAKNKWKKGVFPYPDSIFKKIRIPAEKEEALIKATGNNLFNTNFFNKYELWEACATNENVKKHLPVTRLYNTIEDLEEMLDAFQIVYMKPIIGMQGMGIFVIKKENNEFLLINNKKEKKRFKSIEQVSELIEKMVPTAKYIIQQGVPTVYKNKQFDFRLYFQKNKQMEWVCQGIIGRVAQEESIVTNLKHIAHLTTGDKTIKIVFKVGDIEAKAIMNHTVEVCKELCKLLDQRLGHFGDVALDVIIDHTFKPWILEVNNLYGKKSLYHLQEYEVINKLNITTMEYATFLAGF